MSNCFKQASHDFDRVRDFTDEEWRRITTDVAYLLPRLPKTVERKGEAFPLAIAFEQFNPTIPPRIDDQIVRFNGYDPDDSRPLSGETFLLRKTRLRPNQPKGLDVCQTDARPYNLAVCVVLLVCDHHAPGALVIESTEPRDQGDWLTAKDLVTTHLSSQEMLAHEPDLIVTDHSSNTPKAL